MSSATSSGIQISLSDPGLWNKFHPGTEMIVTNTRARKMFPNLEYTIEGLEDETLYSIWIYMERCDNLKYQYKKGKWEEIAKGEPILPIDRKQHKDGGKEGKHWMSRPISFDHIRLTNNENLKGDSMILMQSMHLYQPVVVVKRLVGGEEDEFRIGMTRFMCVTAYQSDNQIKLKKELNKFASGFRADGGHNRKTPDSTKRGKKRSSDSPLSQPTPPWNPIGFQTPPTFGASPWTPTMTPPTLTPPTFGYPSQGNWTPNTQPNFNFPTPPTLATPSFDYQTPGNGSPLTPPTGATPPFTPLAPPNFDFNTGYNPMWNWGWTPNTMAGTPNRGAEEEFGMENVAPMAMDGFDFNKF